MIHKKLSIFCEWSSAVHGDEEQLCDMNEIMWPFTSQSPPSSHIINCITIKFEMAHESVVEW
jgi:hypothetical protein